MYKNKLIYILKKTFSIIHNIVIHSHSKYIIKVMKCLTKRQKRLLLFKFFYTKADSINQWHPILFRDAINQYGIG